MKPFSAIATFLLLSFSVAAAQTPADFPSRPVKLVVPFAAGGPTDVVARILVDLLSARWNGQSVVIENRPGAGTILATAAVAKSPPDGTTILVATNSLLINPAIGQKLPYDTEKDFTAVSMIATHAGAGAKRLGDMPDVATIAETYPGFDVIAFNAFVAPAGVPAPVLDKLSGDIRAAVNSKEFADKVRHLGIFPLGNTPQELDAWMRDQIARWAEIAKAANIKAD